jgi:hypothetical protein
MTTMDALIEHRRILFEQLLAEYPDVIRTRRSVIDRWRRLLSVSR